MVSPGPSAPWLGSSRQPFTIQTPRTHADIWPLEPTPLDTAPLLCHSQHEALGGEALLLHCISLSKAWPISGSDALPASGTPQQVSLLRAETGNHSHESQRW